MQSSSARAARRLPRCTGLLRGGLKRDWVGGDTSALRGRLASLRRRRASEGTIELVQRTRGGVCVAWGPSVRADLPLKDLGWIR